MPDLTKEQKVIILCIIAITVIGCLVLVFNKYLQPSFDESEILITEKPMIELTQNVSEWIIVHVNGAVRREGVYKLKGGDRFYDLIVLAGGLIDNADVGSINFAATLSDGQKVNIPFKGPQAETLAAKGKRQKKGAASGKDIPIVSLNSASAGDLVKLPGIGKATAAKIIALRETKGRFSDVAELKEVRGISDKKIKKLSPYLAVN